jgi:hypothetical protein
VLVKEIRVFHRTGLLKYVEQVIVLTGSGW